MATVVFEMALVEAGTNGIGRTTLFLMMSSKRVNSLALRDGPCLPNAAQQADPQSPHPAGAGISMAHIEAFWAKQDVAPDPVADPFPRLGFFRCSGCRRIVD